MQPCTPLSADSPIETFQRARRRSDTIFACVRPEAYTAQPIPLRHPFVFYDGHLDAFNWNLLFRQVRQAPAFAPDYDVLFARGIDPASTATMAAPPSAWPDRSAIDGYKTEIVSRLYDLLAKHDPDDPRSTRANRALHVMLEHEVMHQETLCYLIHQLPETAKVPPPDWSPAPDGAVGRPAGMTAVPAGWTVLGSRNGEFAFGWDNEFPHREVQVDAFAIDVLPVTNGDFLAFVEAGGYDRWDYWDDETWAWRTAHDVRHPPFWQKQENAWRLRDLFANRPLPPAWPVYVTQAEAKAYCRFAGKSLPTEAEWHRAAYDDHPEWPYPWGWTTPTAAHGNADFRHWTPVAVGSCPDGASPYGVLDLIGNGWEWTESPFAPFPGFAPDPLYPGYSADFFDGRHAVIKGGSPVTDTRLLRRPFRNWFYWHYPYAYTTFRGVQR